jgi:hypothetical protein
MPFNIFQWGVIHSLAWVVCLADGWIFHNHVLFLVGLFFLFYSLWKMTMAVSPEDEEFERIDKAQGWRKRQIEDLKPKTAQEFYDELRNDVLEEVAVEFDKMKSGGDTTASFAIFIRGLKK